MPRSATVDPVIGSGSVRGALLSTCVNAAREARAIGRRAPACRNWRRSRLRPGHGLRSEDRFQVSSRRRLLRVSMFDRTDVRDWGRRTDRPNERRTAALAPQRTEPKSLLLLREGLPPSCVPPRQSRLTPDPAL